METKRYTCQACGLGIAILPEQEKEFEDEYGDKPDPTYCPQCGQPVLIKEGD